METKELMVKDLMAEGVSIDEVVQFVISNSKRIGSVLSNIVVISNGITVEITGDYVLNENYPEDFNEFSEKLNPKFQCTLKNDEVVKMTDKQVIAEIKFKIELDLEAFQYDEDIFGEISNELLIKFRSMLNGTY